MGQYVTPHGEVISHVNISRTIVEDGGLYTCEATNRAGSSAHSARLNVYGELSVMSVTGKTLLGNYWSSKGERVQVGGLFIIMAHQTNCSHEYSNCVKRTMSDNGDNSMSVT